MRPADEDVADSHIKSVERRDERTPSSPLSSPPAEQEEPMDIEEPAPEDANATQIVSENNGEDSPRRLRRRQAILPTVSQSHDASQHLTRGTASDDEYFAGLDDNDLPLLPDEPPITEASSSQAGQVPFGGDDEGMDVLTQQTQDATLGESHLSISSTSSSRSLCSRTTAGPPPVPCP